MKTFTQWMEAWSSKGPIMGLAKDLDLWIGELLKKKGIEVQPKDQYGHNPYYHIVDAATISPGGKSRGEFGISFMKHNLPPDVLEAIKAFMPKIMQKWELIPYQDQDTKAIEDDPNTVTFNLTHQGNDPYGNNSQAGKSGVTKYGVGGNRYGNINRKTWQDIRDKKKGLSF